MTMVVSSQGQAAVGGGFGSCPIPTAGYEELVQSSELFWEKLKDFHKSLGTKFMIPTVGGKSLDLHCLFVEVTTRGGIEKVVGDRRWKEVIGSFQFPTTITSASFVLRKYYMSLLYRFEQVYFFGRRGSLFSASDSGSGDDASGSIVHDDVAPLSVFSGHDSSKLIPGCSVTGIIDGKFDGGYLVTVNLGAQQMKGVLYHIPQKSNRTSDNLLLKHSTRLKPQHYRQERAIGKKIGFHWNNLTDAD